MKTCIIKQHLYSQNCELKFVQFVRNYFKFENRSKFHSVFSRTHRPIVVVFVNAATLAEGHTLVSTEDKTRVTHTSLNTGLRAGAF